MKLYIIRAFIVKILIAGIYDALISDDCEEYKLKKEEVFRISSDFFKYVSYKILEDFMKICIFLY